MQAPSALLGYTAPHPGAQTGQEVEAGGRRLEPPAATAAEATWDGGVEGQGGGGRVELWLARNLGVGSQFNPGGGEGHMQPAS